MLPVELQRIRAKLHLSQADLAESIGVERQTVWRWETGAVSIPKIAELALLALSAAKKGSDMKTRKSKSHYIEKWTRETKGRATSAWDAGKVRGRKVRLLVFGNKIDRYWALEIDGKFVMKFDRSRPARQMIALIPVKHLFRLKSIELP